MGYTLERFSGECHRILAADPGVEGRKDAMTFAGKPFESIPHQTTSSVWNC